MCFFGTDRLQDWVGQKTQSLMVPKSLLPIQLLLKTSDLKSQHSSKRRLMHLLSETFLEFFSYNWGLISGSPSLFFLVQEFKPSSSGHSMSTTTGMLTWEYTDLGFWTLEDPLGACPGWHCLPLGGWLSSGRRPFAPTVIYNLQPSSVNSECAIWASVSLHHRRRRGVPLVRAPQVSRANLLILSLTRILQSLWAHNDSSSAIVQHHCWLLFLETHPKYLSKRITRPCVYLAIPSSIFSSRLYWSSIGAGLPHLSLCLTLHGSDWSDTHACQHMSLPCPKFSHILRLMQRALLWSDSERPLKASCFECSVPSFWKLLCSLWKHTQEVYPGWQK